MMSELEIKYERQLESRQKRRVAAEDRYLARVTRQEKEAEKMIGELCRDGKTVYYIFPDGGRYRESSSFYELFDFLVRNKYI